MKPAVAVDTNVPIAANGAATAGPSCALACVRKLREIRSERRVLLDSLGLILDEYRRYLSPRGQPGLGDAFFKWLWENQANAQVCCRVTITPEGDGSKTFMEFPDDPDLAAFDPSDRKFVAVVLANGEGAPIINATDRDWWDFREALSHYGVVIEFLCPDRMAARRGE